MGEYALEASELTELTLKPCAFSHLCLAYSSELNRRLRAVVETSIAGTYDHRRKVAFYQVSEALSGASGACRCLPEHAWLLYRGCSDEVPTNAIVAAAELLEHSCDSLPLRWMSLAHSSPWVYYGLSIIKQDLEVFQPKAAPQLVLVPDCSAVECALSLIEESSPHVAEVIRTAISAIVFARGDGLLSASTPMTFGAIYLGVRPTWTTVDCVDLLVHETAHHELVMRSAFVRFLRNPFDVVQSPLRPDRRPLEAVLHAVFVLSRVVDVLKVLANLQDASIRDQAVHKLSSYVIAFDEGILTLRHSAEWTRAGAFLFEQLSRDVGISGA
jgi:hypothetical protein